MPQRRKAQCIGIIWLTLGLIAACAKDDARAALQREAEHVIAAITERDHDGLMDSLAGDFIGPDGMTRDDAARMAQLYFLRFRGISLVAGPLDVTLQGERGRATFVAALTSGQGGLLPEQAQAWHVETQWRRVDDEWLLMAAQWQAVVP